MMKLNRTQLASNSMTPAPVLSFYEYEKNKTYKNDGYNIDFVTDGEDLYVCAINEVTTTEDTLKEQVSIHGGFIKLVSRGAEGKRGIQGERGLNGSTPNIRAEFDGKQMVLYADGNRISVTGDLTGPSWKPALVGETIVWNKTRDNEDPEPIDLSSLRVQEKPILLRVDSDNTKRADEISGPANMIQWKHEGDEYWTNLISINELMNLALAGITFWQDENDADYWHFGNREVVQASYDSTKDGKRIISKVNLGEILFDAGRVPFPDNTLRLDMLEQRLDDLEYNQGVLGDDLVKSITANGKSYLPDSTIGNVNLGDVVKSISVNNGTPATPDGSGNVNLSISTDTSDCVKRVKVNGTTHTPTNGLVDLGNIDGSGSVNTDDCVKSVTINGTTKTPVNGNVSFTISVGDTSLFDVKIENNHLYKTTNGSTWTDLGAIGGSGSGGDGLTEAQVRALIEDALQGYAEIADIPDMDAYITISDLANYATKTYVESRIQDALTDQTDLDYCRIFTLYQRTNSGTVAPSAPVQGNFVWDTSKGEIVLQPTFTSNWENHPQNATTATPYLWQATATYSYKSKSEVKGDDETEYWHVVCLTGEPGKDGEDGNGVEFIYTLVTNKEAFYNVVTPVAPVGQGDDDIPTGWEDRPQGIGHYAPKDITTVQTIADQNTETLFAIEVASIRTYDGANETWSAYGAPFIWSMWGEDGVDGDGVEYIFLATANDPLNVVQYPPIHLYDIYYNANDEVVADDSLISRDHPRPGYANYNTNDWIPDGWTDNPSDVDAEQQYEYVSIRRYNGTTSYWGPFSEPKKWRMLKTVVEAAETHYHPYTEFAFTRTSKDLTGYTVTGGQSYNNPLSGIQTYDENNELDEDIVWTDGIPTTSNDQIWVISALIGDENQQQTNDWTGPSQLGDRAGFQVEYSVDSKANAVYLNPSLWNDHELTLNDFAGTDEEREALWEAAVLNDYGVWSDNVVDPIYMATAVILPNGSWSDWTVARIKGEKGDTGDTGPQGPNGSPGADGTDIEFVYFRTDSESHRPSMSETYGTYDGETKVSEDLYEDDFLPLATASGFTLSDSELTIGNEFFWHDHPAGVTEQLPCEWVGMRHSLYQNGTKLWSDFNIALWSKYGAKGRDGDGVEYIFYRTADYPHTFSGNTNPISWYSASGDYQNPEYIYTGSGWTDDPTGVSSEYPYEWVSQRKYNGTTELWGSYSTPALWSTYSENSESRTLVTLDLNNSEQPVQVTDTNLVVKGTSPIYLNTKMFCRLKTDTGLLLDWGELYIGTMSNGEVTFGSNPNVTFANYTATIAIASNTDSGITRTIVDATADQNRYYSFVISVSFPENHVLTDSYIVPIKVVSAIGGFVGIDYLKFNPVCSEKLVTLNYLSLGSTDVIKKASATATTYSPSSIWILGSIESDSAFDTVSKFRYSYAIDGGTEVMFDDVSQLIQSNKASILSNPSVDYYFNNDGSRITTANPQNYFASLHFWNTDDNQREYDEWQSTMTINLDGTLITDKITRGIGYDSTITDRETSYIIYPGKDGRGEVSTTSHYLSVLKSDFDNVLSAVELESDDANDACDIFYDDAIWSIDDADGLGDYLQDVGYSNELTTAITTAWARRNNYGESNASTSPVSEQGYYTIKRTTKAYSDNTTSYSYDITYNGKDGSDADVSDLQYLKDIFEENVDVTNGAILRETLAVTDGNENDPEVVAFINGDSDVASNVSNGTLMIAAGIPSGEGTLSSRANTAAFRVYEDGSLNATGANVSGTINATSGTIGGFKITDSNLVVSTEEAEFNPNAIPCIKFDTGVSSMDGGEKIEIGMYETNTQDPEIRTKFEQVRYWSSSDDVFEESVKISPEGGIVMKYIKTDTMDSTNNESYIVTLDPYRGISYQKNENLTQTITWDTLFTKLNSIS